MIAYPATIARIKIGKWSIPFDPFHPVGLTGPGDSREDASIQNDGTLVHEVFTNGNAILLLHPDGRKEHVLNEAIEQVFFVRR